ncbi:MAG: hypothetical protein KAU35_10050 [candidate division Zixibacteria bacterium]|nr:hypothetical protein [candidate division Zixibacteria bacterium]
MQKNDTGKKFIVSVDKLTFPFSKYTHDLISHVNGLQQHVVLALKGDTKADFELTIGPGTERPYSSEDNQSVISEDYYYSNQFTMPIRYYLAYFLSISLLEYLYRKLHSEEYLFLRPEHYPRANEFIWRGTLPESSRSTAGGLAKHPPNDSTLQESCHHIRLGIGPLSEELSQRSRQVSEILSGRGLPGISDPYHIIEPIFMHSPQDKVAVVVRDLNAGEPGALEGLIDLIADSSRRDAEELLSALSHSSWIDPHLASRAREAVEARQTSDHALAAQTTDDAAEPAKQRMIHEFVQKLIKAHDASKLRGVDPSREDEVTEWIRSKPINELLPVISNSHPEGTDMVELFGQLVHKTEPERAADLLKRWATPIEGAEVKQETATTGTFGLPADGSPPSDELGYEEYASAIADIVMHQDTGTPMTFAITGPWGRGKTTLMDLINKAVKRKKGRPAGTVPCFTANINAWEFSDTEKVRAEFYSRILQEIDSSLDKWRRFKFRLLFLKNQSVWELTLWILATFMIVIVPAVVVYLLASGSMDLSISEETLTGLIATGLAVSIVRNIWRHFSRFSKFVFSRVGILFGRHAPLDQHQVMQNIACISKTLTQVRDRRLVFFIDDIDRCQPDNVLRVLEAIKLFLDIEGFVFFLAMDTKIVRHAVGTHYSFMCKDGPAKEEMGRSYLEKIIQVPFHLPPLTRDQKLKLIESILKKHRREIVIKLEPIGFALETEGPTIVTGSSESGGYEVDDTSREAMDSDQNKAKKKPRHRDDVVNVTTPGLVRSEYEALISALSLPEFDISPRLVKRMANIYLIARQLLLRERWQTEGFVPGESFVKWIAVSVVCPFESAALIGWLRENNWRNPVLESSGKFVAVFEGNGTFSNFRDGNPAPPFEARSLDALNRFGVLLTALKIDFEEIEKTQHITGLFNLVLD